ncbi:hypothetical protein [Streptomyces sp. NPDC007088]|uniref:hypothetical protein n=1 Tax=Streptomyces sp. NPDC007088 TaxID=3364773 RepID=UPI003673D76E
MASPIGSAWSPGPVAAGISTSRACRASWCTACGSSGAGFYERTRALDTFTAPDGRVYRLLFGQSTRHDNRLDPEGRWMCFWGYRWDHGVKWLGPSRENADLAYKQFELIRQGRAW